MVFKNNTIPLLLILLCISAVPLIKLLADPAAAVNFSSLQDEGRHLYAARNKALFGQWTLPEEQMLNTGILKETWMPSSQGLFFLLPHTLLVLAVFKVLGVGLMQARLLSVIEAFLTIFILFLGLRKRRGNLEAFAIAGILGTNFLFMHFARTGQTYELLFLLGAALIALTDKAFENTFYAGLAAMTCFVIFLANGITLYLSGVWLLSCMAWKMIQKPVGCALLFRILLCFLGTITVCFTAWLFFYWLPHWDRIVPFFHESVDGMRGTALSIFMNKIRERNVMITFEKTPLVAYLGFIAASLEIGMGPRRMQSHPLHFFCALWLFLGSMAASMLPSPHVRFCVLLILPACVLTGSLLCRMHRVPEAWRDAMPKNKISTLGLMAFATWVFVSHFAAAYGGHGGTGAVRILLIAVASVMLSIAMLLAMLAASRAHKFFIPCCVICIMAIGLMQHGAYLVHAKEFANISMHKVHRWTQETSKVAGGMAETLVLASSAKAIPAFILNGSPARREIIDESMAQALGITHLLVNTLHINEYQIHMPNIMKKAQLRETFTEPLVGTILLYDISILHKTHPDPVIETVVSSVG